MTKGYLLNLASMRGCYEKLSSIEDTVYISHSYKQVPIAFNYGPEESPGFFLL